jgi:hypothetical protein
LDAVEGRFNDRECDAPTLADVHVWLLLFADDLVLTSESEVGLQQQLDTLQQFCAECGLTVNVKKTKVMVFNSVDPCQKFVFEDDIIERVQSFNYLGILLETTPNLDNAVEHLTAASRCSLFALNRRCAELHIMDIKLRCDLLNMLVRSIASYACEIWVDSKKIKVIEIVYRGFLKSLLRVRKTTSTSIVLVELNKFPFEHFAWGQTLLYYNRVSTVTKDYILGKAWEAQLAMLDTGKKCWAGSVKKWLLHNQPQEVTGFLPPIQSPLETTLQLVATRAFQAGTTELLLGIVLGSTHIHSTCLARLVQPVGGRSTTRGPINQEVGIPPLPGFPHTMLNVKRVKDNMRLAFIEKLFTNREIGTNVQTRYLRFKGMSYKSERYLCDINCVQLRKALARFRCGNT